MNKTQHLRTLQFLKIKEYFSDKWYLLLLQDESTALMIASKRGNTETVKCLIDGKASVDMQQKASIHFLYLDLI